MKKADWTIDSIAIENHNLNRSYFESGEYKNLISYTKLGDAVRFVLDKTRKLNILDIGCGTAWCGVYLQKEGLLNNAFYHGCDISQNMCELAEKNMPGCEFFTADISQSPVNKKYDVVLESAVVELASLDWKKVLKNILMSSSKWVILHRLFYVDGKTSFEQVTTYLNIPDIRIHVGLDELGSVVRNCGFQIVHRDLWAKTHSYNQGTFIIGR